ncbi:MAG: septum formation initiator [Bacteroidetes bacterium]|nr:septum formation initiator [Bacteroidota bacterium]
MKKITIAALLIISQSAFAQETSEELKKEITPLIKKIEVLETKATNQGKEIEGLNLKLSTTNKQIDSLENKIAANEIAISQTKTDLTNEITQSGVASDGKIKTVSKDLSKNSLYGIIGVLLAILLSGVLFFFWKKRQETDKSELINKLDNSKKEINKEIENTKSSLTTIEQKLFEEYNKQVAGIEQLFSSISELNKGKSPATITEQDHSLTLKVADEVTRINAFANTLNPTKQEAIALKSSVKRIIDNFKANKYEIVDLLGQKYDDRLNIIVVGESIDSNLNSGEEKITKIIKPLVKFNGEQIQAAQVEISIGQ